MFSQAASSSSPHLPPTRAQLQTLLALPSGMSKSMNGKWSSSGKREKKKFAKDGQVISKVFESSGSRPQPTNGMSMNQGITLEMSAIAVSFITSSSTGGFPIGAGRSFALSDFTGGPSVLGAVFDQYKFEQIECWISPQVQLGPGAYPELLTAVDLDDATPPTGVSSLQDKQGSIITNGPAGHYHKWKPHMAVAAFSGAFTSYSNEVAGWIDSASPSVQHYGLKTLTVSNSTSPTTFDMHVRAVISFRGPVVN